jgi:DNA-binding NarL/FixJ family response regulator
MSPLRVLVCDDNDGFRGSLLGLLATIPDVEVVGEAPDGRTAVRLALTTQPDVVLMDLAMPGLDGVEATRQILTDAPHIGVVVLTMIEDDDSVFAAMKAGARSYLLKGARRAEIARAVTAVGNGEAVFGAAIATRLIGYFSVPRQPRGADAFPELTPRQIEILALMARHESNPGIANRLDINEKTVRNNVSAILTKLCVRDRAEAIAAAHAANLGSTPRYRP